MHIALVGGIGLAATEHYYRGLIERHDRSGVPLELTIVHADVRELARNVAALARQRQAEVSAGLIRRLAGAGAQFAAVTSMGGHFCIGELAPLSPLPLLNAIPHLEVAIRERGLMRIGILGTKLVMETGLYGGISSATIVAPKVTHSNVYIGATLKWPRPVGSPRASDKRFSRRGNGCIGIWVPRPSFSAEPTCSSPSRVRTADFLCSIARQSTWMPYTTGLSASRGDGRCHLYPCQPAREDRTKKRAAGCAPIRDSWRCRDRLIQSR